YPVGAQDVPSFFRHGAVDRVREGEVMVLVPFIDETPKTMLWQAAADMRFRMPGGYLFIPGPDYPLLYAPPSPLRDALNAAEHGAPLASLDPAGRAAMAADLRAWNSHVIVVGPMRNEER